MQIGAGEGSNLAGDSLWRLLIALLEIVVGLGLLLTPYWTRRKLVRLRSSTAKSRQRHIVLFTVAGGAAVLSGIFLIVQGGDIGASLIPLGMIGAAVATALLPGRDEQADEEQGES